MHAPRAQRRALAHPLDRQRLLRPQHAGVGEPRQRHRGGLGIERLVGVDVETDAAPSSARSAAMSARSASASPPIFTLSTRTPRSTTQRASPTAASRSASPRMYEPRPRAGWRRTAPAASLRARAPTRRGAPCRARPSRSGCRRRTVPGRRSDRQLRPVAWAGRSGSTSARVSAGTSWLPPAKTGAAPTAGRTRPRSPTPRHGSSIFSRGRDVSSRFRHPPASRAKTVHTAEPRSRRSWRQSNARPRGSATRA